MAPNLTADVLGGQRRWFWTPVALFVGVAVTLLAARGVIGEVRPADIPRGTYEFWIPEFGPDQSDTGTVYYNGRNEWLQVDPLNEWSPGAWTMRMDDAVYRAYGAEPVDGRPIQVVRERSDEEMVPARFVFDPLFLYHLERDTLPWNFTAEGAPIAEARHATAVPSRIVGSGDVEIEVVGYSADLDVRPLAFLREVQADSGFVVVDRVDLPSVEDLDLDDDGHGHGHDHGLFEFDDHDHDDDHDH